MKRKPWMAIAEDYANNTVTPPEKQPSFFFSEGVLLCHCCNEYEEDGFNPDCPDCEDGIAHNSLRKPRSTQFAVFPLDKETGTE